MNETPKAAQAFADYVAMGPSRSLAKLHECYQSATEAPPTKRLETLKAWSTRFGWQARIAEATTEQVERAIRQAAELDSASFLRTSEELYRRAQLADAFHLDDLIRLRESVRKPAPKGGTSVSVGVEVSLTTEQRQIAERIAASRGVEVEELVAEIEDYLQEARS